MTDRNRIRKSLTGERLDARQQWLEAQQLAILLLVSRLRRLAHLGNFLSTFQRTERFVSPRRIRIARTPRLSWRIRKLCRFRQEAVIDHRLHAENGALRRLHGGSNEDSKGSTKASPTRTENELLRIESTRNTSLHCDAKSSLDQFAAKLHVQLVFSGYTGARAQDTLLNHNIK